MARRQKGGGQRKSPAKTKSKRARKVAANKAKAAAQSAAASRISGQSPQATALGAAANAATSFGVKLAEPGTISRSEAQAIAEAAASATAERLGIRVGQKGKISRSEAQQAAEIGAQKRLAQASVADTVRNRKQLAQTAAEQKITGFVNDPEAADKLAGLAKKVTEDFATSIPTDPNLTRQEAVAATTQLILDKLGYPPLPELSRNAARAVVERLKRSRAHTV